MNGAMPTVLQIVPNLPPAIDGIGDYALQLARRLREQHQVHTRFIIGDPQWSGSDSIEGFPVTRVESRTASALRNLLDQYADIGTILLHYVGYGYQDRGIPFWLEVALRPGQDRTSQTSKGSIANRRLLTMFHEMYASGPITSSAFWLRPVQIGLTNTFVRRSHTCFVSNELYRALIQRAVADQSVVVVPVGSNFGEPELSEIDLSHRDPHRWIICGGTRLVERSLRSLLPLISKIPSALRPKHLDVVGGYNNPAVIEILNEILNSDHPLTSTYRPQISVQDASDLLRQACLAWIDYLGPGRIWPELITKSTAFAACSAHGVLSVFSHGQTFQPQDPNLIHPGVFYLGEQGSRLPDPEQIPDLCQAVYDWYQTRSSAKVITQAYAKVLLEN